MIKFILVDDEPLALESFAELLDWRTVGCELAGCAANGVEALALVQKTLPDIVFTDIRMPIMDGLELCRQLHEHYPETKIVILTAYRDFDYAHKALTYGVTEYLLKNQIEPEVILPLMARLCREIETLRLQKDDRQHHYYQSVLLNMTPTDLPAAPSTRQQCCCVLFQYRTPYILDRLCDCKPQELSLDQAELAGLLPPEAPLILRQLVWLDSKSWGVLLFAKDQDRFDFSRLAGAVRSFSERLREHFLQAYSISLFTLFEISDGTPQKVKAAFDGMLDFSPYSVFIRHEELCPYTRLKHLYKTTDDNHPALRQTIQQASDAACYARLDELNRALKTLQTAFERPVYDLGQFRYICNHLLEQLEWLLEKNALPPLRQYIRQTHPEVARLFCADEIWQWLVEEFHRAARLAAPAKAPARNRKIELALEYIHKNYAQRLTARQVGEKAGLSEVYFSNLFKKETGVTFGDYLTAYRMNMAKYLILNGDYKIYEVAEMTGYSSPQYFSQIFLKEVGRTPLEYKTYGKKTE